MRSTFKTVFYVNGSKERNGIVPILGSKVVTIAQEILAGYTLNNKNPSEAPATAQVIGAIPAFVPIATTEKKVATIMVTLDTRPSTPSVKFTPFTVPITAK